MSKILLSAFLLLSTIFLGGCFSSCGETAQIQKNMTDGLKKIYGKEFVVERPHMTGNPGFGYHYEAKAYPRDNPKLEFTVAYNMNQKGDYGENYLEVLWADQGEKEMREILRSLYGDDFLIYIYSFEYYNRDFKSLNHTEVLKASDGWVHLWIKYIVFTDKKIDKQIEAERVYRILDKLMLKNHLNKYRLLVGYSPRKYKINRYFENEYKRSGKSFSALYQEGILTNHLDIHKLEIDAAGIKKVDVEYIVSLFK